MSEEDDARMVDATERAARAQQDLAETAARAQAKSLGYAMRRDALNAAVALIGKGGMPGEVIGMAEELLDWLQGPMRQ